MHVRMIHSPALLSVWQPPNTHSAYEMERLENIKRNHEMLCLLGLESSEPPPPKRCKTKPKLLSEAERRSSRLQGIQLPDCDITSDKQGLDTARGMSEAEVWAALEADSL
eukprot:3898497-Prymnesium_polylepis.1